MWHLTAHSSHVSVFISLMSHFIHHFWFGHMFNTCRALVWHLLDTWLWPCEDLRDTCWQHVEHVAFIFRSLFGRLSDTFQTLAGYCSDTVQTLFGYLPDIWTLGLLLLYACVTLVVHCFYSCCTLFVDWSDICTLVVILLSAWSIRVVHLLDRVQTCWTVFDYSPIVCLIESKSLDFKQLRTSQQIT